MKRFEFRAAKVLDLRQRQHQQTLAALAAVQRTRDLAAAALAQAEQAVARAHAEMRTCLAAGGTTTNLLRHRNWIIGLQAGTEGCRRQLAQRELEVERAAADVRRTHRQSRVLERLKDRAWEAYQAESDRQSAIEMDQLAVMQHARRTSGV